ncbi:MAG TPA: phage holin family protein [Cellulomonas sp.]
MAFLLRVIVNGVAIWLTTLILRPGFDVVTSDQQDSTWKRVLAFLVVGLIFGLVNAVIKPLVKVLSLPLYILTLGLFTLVINALMLMLTGWISEHTSWGLHIDNFGTAVIAALIVSVLSFLLSVLIGRRDRHSH